MAKEKKRNSEKGVTNKLENQRGYKETFRRG